MLHTEGVKDFTGPGEGGTDVVRGFRLWGPDDNKNSSAMVLKSMLSDIAIKLQPTSVDTR